MFLQETHGRKQSNRMWLAEWGNKGCFANGMGNSQGVVTLIGKGCPGVVKEVVHDINGRYLILKLNVNDSSYCLANIYSPNTDEPSFCSEIFQIITAMECDYNIIGGAFNVILTETDRHNGKIYHPRALKVIQEFMNAEEMIDIWRDRNPDLCRFTWAHHNVNVQWSRIDYFLVSQPLSNIITGCEIKPGLLTDHSMIETEIDVSRNKRGRGTWKFNNTLLDNEMYVTVIEQVIAKVMDS